MTDDEYLVTRGWETDGLDDGGEALWTHPRRPKGHGGGRRMHFTTAEAVETQIAEDRACLAFVQNHSPVHDDSGVPYDSLTVDAAQPDARLVPASGLLRTAEGRTVRFNPAGWRSVRLEADGSTTWFAKGPALLPIVPRIDKEPNVAKRGHVWMGMVKR